VAVVDALKIAGLGPADGTEVDTQDGLVDIIADASPEGCVCGLGHTVPHTAREDR